jgi:hypothetical protein
MLLLLLLTALMMGLVATWRLHAAGAPSSAFMEGTSLC